MFYVDVTRYSNWNPITGWRTHLMNDMCNNKEAPHDVTWNVTMKTSLGDVDAHLNEGFDCMIYSQLVVALWWFESCVHMIR
jgi:hypothetical protein